MAGYELNEGQYRSESVSEEELWSAISNVFTSNIRTQSSYKYGLLKSILDNLYNVDDDFTLTFDQIFSKFAEIYWNLILKYKLSQQIATTGKKGTYLEQIIIDSVSKYALPANIPYESLSPSMMLDINTQVKNKCKKYVIGALFEDTKQLFYSFSKKGQWIKFNPLMYEFICKHKIIIEKLNYYEWAKFLESINSEDASHRLLTKIDESAKRTNLANIRNILFTEFESKCFYCQVPLKSKIDVDHFIPWSFVKDDNIWNMVLSCPKCNRSKNDRLPDIHYLTTIIERNNSDNIHNIELFNKSQLIDLGKLYYWAQINGYKSDWRPTNTGI